MHSLTISSSLRLSKTYASIVAPVGFLSPVNSLSIRQSVHRGAECVFIRISDWRRESVNKRDKEFEI